VRVLAIDPALPPMHSDPVKLRQCLFNLLGNAAKFTEGGTIRLRVSLRGDQSGSRELVAEVEDTGVGMSSADLFNNPGVAAKSG
jgi:signal transduction histidine kinase